MEQDGWRQYLPERMTNLFIHERTSNLLFFNLISPLTTPHAASFITPPPTTGKARKKRKCSGKTERGISVVLSKPNSFTTYKQ